MSIFARKPLELSVTEMDDRAYGKPDSDGGRLLLLKSVISKCRYVPKVVCETAKKHLAETDDVEKTLRYIANAFYIFRETANKGFMAPHYKVDGAYEWPEPLKFSWGHMDAIIIGGEYLHGEIPEREDANPEIRRRRGSKIEMMEIDMNDGESKTTIAELIPGKDDANESLKYKIPDFSKVGFVPSQEWQNMCLRGYANPVHAILKDMLKRKLTKKEARDHLEKNMKEILDDPVDAIVGRPKRWFEKADYEPFFF